MRVTHTDLERVLLSVNQLAADSSPESLPERTFSAVKNLVAADVISFEGFGTDNYYEGPLWYAPVENVTDEMLAAIGEYVFDHPCFNGDTVQQLKESVRISDYVTLPEFKRTTIYNEFFRLLGTDRQLVSGLHISQKLTITCSMCRLQKDYTDRDCRVFDLLTPHLTAAFRQASFIHRLNFEAKEMRTAIEFARLAVVTIDHRMRMQMETPTAAKLLAQYFSGDSSGLPEELIRYVKHHLAIFTGDEFYLPPAPFEKMTSAGKLIARLIFNSEARTTMLLLKEVSNSSSKDYQSLGLTNRESEVLLRISHGKTDGEIAELLKISVRTVHKHVENIFIKLGVETRTAAASKIL